MKTDTHKTIYLKDYTPYPYDVQRIDLNFDIHDGYTIVTTLTKFTRTGDGKPDLFLNGEDLQLESININGRILEESDYTLNEKGLSLPCPEEEVFSLGIVTRIEPEKNTRLEGLYRSGGTYCTQCEAEGFRRITFYPDRPDVMSVFSTRIEADYDACPVLLSNGNLREKGPAAAGGNRHYAIWDDPFPKPCYLFALVAGELGMIGGTYTTASGRRVNLDIYVRPGDESQCEHAMESLKKSMRWEEETYGLEYDLDVFNIVAVSDFNMGAMENKSLNIFNTALVLAQQETATDQDFMRVESVIAHEYFHNWSGNRVTCRDWFQLSLKEGLTVFRDQEFSADMNSRAVQRIDDVMHLRRLQFPEDAGPLAHPVRPDNYIEINNFYTMTVYEKGAEVIRMMHTILGPENYRKGTDLYFSRHDGQAVTCDDFVQCMEDASGHDLSHFKLWYSQAGTPQVKFKGTYDEDKKRYTVTLSQKTPPTPGQKTKKPLHIPVAIGLIGKNGDDMDLGDGETTRILHLTEKEQTFTFENIPARPVPSVLRNFSAPVKLNAGLTNTELAFLMVHDHDGFNRWESGQNFALKTLNAMIDKGKAPPKGYIKAYGGVIDRAFDHNADKALIARSLALPDMALIGQSRDPVDPDAIFEAREKLLGILAGTHQKKLARIYTENDMEEFSITPEAMGLRALRNSAMHLLAARDYEDAAAGLKQHYDGANNMTDRVAALSLLARTQSQEREEAFADFYQRFREYPLVIDKWFALQAQAVRDDTVENLRALRAHPDFNIRNPNRVRSLYAAFAMNNPVNFHARDGRGYEFLTDAVIELNDINPQIAARLLTPIREWRRYTPGRQELMQKSLQRIIDQKDLSPDVYEIASKSLK